MKKINLLLGLLVAVLLGLGWGTAALAYHDGGVAHCDGCHTMHNSEDGVSIIDGGTAGIAGDHLTKGADPSSTCLNCHEGSGSYHIFSTDGSSYKPGGDFYWMTKTFTYVTHGTHNRSSSNHGHNIIAADFGLVQDEVHTTAPGGTFQAAWLACSSCHDPHGGKIDKTGPIEVSGSYGADPTVQQTGNYRLLGDAGYKAGPGFTFANRPPIATTNNSSETDSNHTDYGKGMSEWCANCHTGFLAATVGDHRHPASNTSTLAGQGLDTNYNAYVKTGDLSGTAATAYLALTPFERQIDDPTTLVPTSTQGPTGSSNVMCLTCHRAHASAFPNIGRWDFETEFPAVDSHPKDTDGGATPGDELNSYYGRDMVAQFGESQRSFCNKCHVKD